MTRWQTNKTLLLVGEGDTEVAFLQHLKALYAPRGCGLAVKIKNAHGKGAKHVVEWTCKQIASIHYDAVGALLDTDTDWSKAVAKKAKSAGIHVLKSEPCFEAMMLRLLGITRVADAKTLKACLAPFVCHNALDKNNYAESFGQARLETCRRDEPTIDALLALFEKTSGQKTR